jgi:small subunit ribosomal protein S17
MTEQAQAAGPGKNQRRLVGRVVSDRMQKTVVVRVERRVRHPEIGKILTRSRKYHAHAAAGEYRVGDLVEIAECRPISKTKSWTVTRLLEKSRAA